MAGLSKEPLVLYLMCFFLSCKIFAFFYKYFWRSFDETTKQLTIFSNKSIYKSEEAVVAKLSQSRSPKQKRQFHMQKQAPQGGLIGKSGARPARSRHCNEE
jgi:hypothetical protein